MYLLTRCGTLVNKRTVNDEQLWMIWLTEPASRLSIHPVPSNGWLYYITAAPYAECKLSVDVSDRKQTDEETDDVIV